MICDLYFPHVCGVNGVTYWNSCKADFARVEIKHLGYCGDKKICIKSFSRVCGVNGHTYLNSCFADLDEVKIKHEGRC